jgi:hypothetical protein
MVCLEISLCPCKVPGSDLKAFMAGALRIAEIPKECSGRDSLRRPLRGEQMSAYGRHEPDMAGSVGDVRRRGNSGSRTSGPSGQLLTEAV